MKIEVNSISFNIAVCLLFFSFSGHVWAAWTDYGPWTNVQKSGIELSVRIKGEVCDERTPQSYQHWYEVFNNSRHNVTYDIGITNLSGVNVGVAEMGTIGPGQTDSSAGNWWYDSNCATVGTTGEMNYKVSITIVSIDGVSVEGISVSPSNPSQLGQGASTDDSESTAPKQQSDGNGGIDSITSDDQNNSPADASQGLQSLATDLKPLEGLDVEDKETTIEFTVSGGIGIISLNNFYDKIGEVAQVSSVFGYGAAAGLRLFPLQFGSGDYAFRLEINGQYRLLTGNTLGYGDLNGNLTDYDLDIMDTTIQGSAIMWWGWLGAGAKYKLNDINIGITDSYDSTGRSIFNQNSEFTSSYIVPELLIGSFDQRKSFGSLNICVDSDLAASLNIEADYFWIRMDYYPFTFQNSNEEKNVNGIIGDMLLGTRIPF